MTHHHVKLFVVGGTTVYYVHHNTSDPGNDDAGVQTRAPTGDTIRFKARDAGGFTIEFKAESPFVSGAGAPGSPINSANGSLTTEETLKPIATVIKHFPYTVTIAGLTDDPEIIIDNSGGGGGP